jgi:hypothetical protein
MEVGAFGSMIRLAAMLFVALALGCAQANAQLPLARADCLISAIVMVAILFQPCDQIEIMAMARRAADRRAMLGLTAS